MNTPREETQIFHFLLPDGGMANYSDKLLSSVIRMTSKPGQLAQRVY